MPPLVRSVSFLHVDFGSSFGTVFQGVLSILASLERAEDTVPKVHILHSRRQSRMRSSLYSLALTLRLSVPNSLIWNFARFVLNPLEESFKKDITPEYCTKVYTYCISGRNFFGGKQLRVL